MEKCPFLVVCDSQTVTKYPDPLVGEVPFSQLIQSDAPTPMQINFAATSPHNPSPPIPLQCMSHTSSNPSLPVALEKPNPQQPVANTMLPTFAPSAGGTSSTVTGLEDYGALDADTPPASDAPPATTDAPPATTGDKQSAYELQRAANMAENAAHLASLGLVNPCEPPKASKPANRKRTTRPQDKSHVSRARRSSDDNFSGVTRPSLKPPASHLHVAAFLPIAGNKLQYNDDKEVEEDEEDDKDVYDVSRISAHRGKKRRQFLVHWEGYEETTWETEASLRNNSVLLEYLGTITSADEPEKMQPTECQQVS